MKKSLLRQMIKEEMLKEEVISTEKIKNEIEKDGIEYTFTDYYGPRDFKQFEDKTIVKLALNFTKSLDAIKKYLKI